MLVICDLMHCCLRYFIFEAYLFMNESYFAINGGILAKFHSLFNLICAIAKDLHDLISLNQGKLMTKRRCVNGRVTNVTDKYQACIDVCMQCTQACYECLRACMNEPDAAARKACMGILVECALICQQAVAYMSFDAQHSKDLCKLCANIVLYVHRNVLCLKMLIAKSVHKYAINALMSVERWPVFSMDGCPGVVLFAE